MTLHQAPFPLANAIRERLESETHELVAGRDPKLLQQVTPTTSVLLRYWFEDDFCSVRSPNFHEGQRAAILAIIYAHEVLGTRSLKDLYETVAPESLDSAKLSAEVSRARHRHPKYAAKMATGTGKTWVLNALLIWQYLNKVANPDDDRFTCNFLLVAPGLIVYERLLDSFLGKAFSGDRDFTSSDIYSQRELFVPDHMRTQVFEFLQSSVVAKTEIGRKVTGPGVIAIANWHLLAGHEDPEFLTDGDAVSSDSGGAAGPREAVESIFPITPGIAAGNNLSALDRRLTRGQPLEALKALPDLLVFNDEAHHIHEVRRDDEITDVEWQKSLDNIASTKGARFIQVDFSATPYNEVGTGEGKGRRYFPHIVVDFDLASAMRAGLVKALALDKRKSVASLPLDFRAERNEQGRVVGLSPGQRTMLRAGLRKLQILEEQFKKVSGDKHPKLLIICEDTNVSPHVIDFLQSTGVSQDDILRVDSGRKTELGSKEWEPIREKLFGVDNFSQPRVIVSVLMLREGFDVNNICVVVPLRSSEASILLEQTIGRGLRLMWRGNSEIDDLKRETRDRIARRQEPNNYFDVLFIVEHPAFSRFYEDLLGGSLVGGVGEETASTTVTGDLELVDLRPGSQAYDFEIPIILRSADEELQEPSLDPMELAPSKYQIDWLLKQIGRSDNFVSMDAQTGTQYGDYSVDGGVLTATGYNDYLSRMTTRITDALGRGLTSSAGKYKEISHFPILKAYKSLLTGWLDTYIKNRLFDQAFDPLVDENWRVLLLDDIAHGIAGVFATRLVEGHSTRSVAEPIVSHRNLSDVKTIPVRTNSCVVVSKCIYDKLPVARKGGGLERLFIEWADQDSRIEALLKVHEYRHDFLRRPYLKSDGMPALYSPDFLIRTDTDVFVVETKAQTALSDENVRRKQRAAVNWCEQLNTLPGHLRSDLSWSYVLIGESLIHEWHTRNARASELLEYARLRPVSDAPEQQRLL